MELTKPTKEHHEATMRRHYAESIALGAKPADIHRELKTPIFNDQYSIQQITSITSWIAGEILRGRRVNEISWDEGPEHKNETANFDNSEKNGSRDWQVQQLLKHTTDEQRRDMNYLLLPGRNEYDLEAFTKAGLQGKNLLTYILENFPKTIAQYLRNGRKYDVQNKRIGKMGDLFPSEIVNIRGAYIDYFGQLCPDSSLESHLMPLDPNYYPICVGFNFKKGREHAQTKKYGNESKASEQYVAENLHKIDNGADLASLYLESKGVPVNCVHEMKDLRDEMVYQYMFMNMGIANQKNWVAPDYLKNFAKSLPGNQDFDELPMIEQFLRVSEAGKAVVTLLSMLDQYAQDLRIYMWMAATSAGVWRGALNYPVIRHLEPPFSYKSGESNQPFRSYFGVLETKKSHYEKYMRAIEFIFSLGNVMMKQVSNIEKTGPIRMDINNLLKVTGHGSKKEITVLEGAKNKPIYSINHDFLLEAQKELGISGCSVQHHEDKPFETRRKEDQEIVERAKGRGEAEEVLTEIASRLKKVISTPGMNRMVQSGKHGRNDPCPCGSGQKFKKCCRRC